MSAILESSLLYIYQSNPVYPIASRCSFDTMLRAVSFAAPVVYNSGCLFALFWESVVRFDA
jgi:hypothetical protein